MQEHFRIGERVLVDGSGSSGQARTGVIRYYGPTQFREGQWVGIELDEPSGKNDGTVEGVAYFKCAKDYGLFVHPSKVSRMADSLVASMMGLSKQQQQQQEPPPQRGAVETSPTPATVPSSTATVGSSAGPAQASIPILPVLSSLAPPPPFQLSEVGAKLVELSREFGKENHASGPHPSKPAVNIVDELPSTVTMRQPGRYDERNHPLLPMTPTKQQQHPHQLLPMTPGSAARGSLAQELAKRQAEVNHIRRHVEPLLLSARAIVNDNSTSDQQQEGNLQAIVVKLIAHMRDYDKVISRYERQLSKILEHQNQSRASPSAAAEELRHELDLARTRLVDAEERARSAEGRLAVAMRAGDQQERSMRNSTTALIQELSDEKAALEEKVLRLEAEASVSRLTNGGSSSALSQAVMVEELRRELEAARRENQRLAQMHTDPPSIPSTVSGQSIGVNVHDDQSQPDHQLRKEHDQLVADYKELTEAKFKEARYFEEQLRDLRDQLARAQSELSTQKAIAASLQEQIDTRLDVLYDSGKTGSAQQAQMAQLEAKLAEATQQVDGLRHRLSGAEAEKSRLEAKCLDLQTQLTRIADSRRTSTASATMQPSGNAAALEEARKQIEALEAELLHHTDKLVQQKDASKTAIQAGLAEMQATLGEEQSRRTQAERRLAQVEHEKGLIEEELGRLRLGSTNASAHPGSPEDQARVGQLKSQLARKGPQTQQFARLASFFAALPRTLTRSGRPAVSAVNLSGIREAYAGVKEGLDRLEAVHERAIDRLQGHPVMDAGEDVERTPTSRRRPAENANGINGIQGKTLFSADLHDSSRGFSAPQFGGYKV